MLKEYIQEFGVKMFLTVSVTRIMRKLHLPSYLIDRFDDWKHEKISDYLDARYGNDISILEFKSNEKVGHIEKGCPIWIFWWQGENGMPPIVEACYRSVQINAEKHTVVLLTKYNIKDYVQLPAYIYEKVENGKISLTHFSDIVRENLLYEYGGIWMDATIYMTSPFSETLYEYDYYTLNGAFRHWKWSGFYQACAKHHIFPQIVSDIFNRYWFEHNILITYLLIDCIFSVVYRNSDYVRDCIDDLIRADSSVFLLNDKYLDMKYDEELFRNLGNKTNIHKLSYKFQHERTIDDIQTFYGKIIEGVKNEDTNACKLEN